MQKEFISWIHSPYNSPPSTKIGFIAYYFLDGVMEHITWHTDAELNPDERPFFTKEMNKLPYKFQSRSDLFQIENKTIRELDFHTRPFRR